MLTKRFNRYTDQRAIDKSTLKDIGKAELIPYGFELDTDKEGRTIAKTITGLTKENDEKLIKSSTEFLKRELGLHLRNTQEKSIIESLKTPDKYIERRDNLINEAISAIVPSYNKSVADYYAAGHSIGSAQDLARQEANLLLAAKLRVIDESLAPGYENLTAIPKIDAYTRELTGALMNKSMKGKGIKEKGDKYERKIGKILEGQSEFSK